ncbi:pyridoxal phosphate-dependent aminotransferase [Phytohabitans sp. ZYX-F-186]|uniref:Pyridoxal phosphate-dependent aminotransferase n=1 Tax=Phytohabitans maris TaxID=3071409 RepID=A0ABU0ZSN4_9ACTN|nr:pyridoxal phosphate-dependent aminotransferase [Phytohabitans sp. ZYX-F-186]MDQ7909968.1 pyridoxal phosphate-dependent aminotransferase [Phytohabitans sp. ZYX-F-186]
MQSGTETDTATAAVTRMMAGPVRAGEVDLSVGEPDQPLPAVLVETAVRSLRDGRTGYTPKLGLPDLRDLVAADLDGRRPPSDDVVVTVGGTGAVAVALAAVCVPGGAVLVPDPAWPNYRVLAERLGVAVLSYPQGESGDAFLDLETIEAGLRAGARLVVVNSPSNPTGAVASAAVLRRLVDLVRAHDAFILSDEAYESIVFAGGRAPTPRAAGGADLTFTARTFSKTYSMTGLRVGALISPPSFRVAVAALHGTTAGCAPITAQLTAIEALRSLPDRGAELSVIYRARFGAALRILGPWAPPVPAAALGGFYLWLDARPTGRTSAEVCAALRARGVVASSGQVYTPTDGFVRLALTAPDAQLVNAITVVRQELDRLTGR